MQLLPLRQKLLLFPIEPQAVADKRIHRQIFCAPKNKDIQFIFFCFIFLLGENHILLTLTWF